MQQAYTALVLTQKIQNSETNIFSSIYNLSKKLSLSTTIYQLIVVKKLRLSVLLLKYALNMIIFYWLPPGSVMLLYYPILSPTRQVPLSAGVPQSKAFPIPRAPF